MITLTTILARHKDEEIVNRVIELYPDQKSSEKGYYVVLKKLRSLGPQKRDHMKLDVSHVVDNLDPEEIYEYDKVSGVVEGEEMSYAIEYTAWSTWLGMEFTTRSLAYPEVDLIAHCLWEMTWSGFEEEEIQETYSSLMERAKEIEERVMEKSDESI